MILAAIVPSIVTMLVSYNYTTSSLKERTVEDNSNLLFQGSENIRNYLEELNRASLYIYTDPFFYRSLAYGFENISANGQQLATLQSIGSSIRDIDQLYLYVYKKRQATLLVNNMPKRLSDVDIYLESEPVNYLNLHIEPPHSSHSYGFSLNPRHDPGQPVITFYRSIMQIPSDNQIGTLAMDVKLDAISRISGQLFRSPNEQLYLLDEHGFVIYSGEQELIGQLNTQSWYTDHDLTGYDSGSFEDHGQIYIYKKIVTPFAKWTLVKEIPSSYLTHDADKAAVINVLLLSASLIIIIIAIIFISIGITKPIKQLVKYMNRIQTGDLSLDVVSTRKDEIGVLYRRFGSMMDTINNLILVEYKLKLANSTNQLRALQAQVNPHFMNNTLQTIGSLALEQGMKKIYTLISTLSRMMRYSMYNTDKPVTLQIELQHVKDYLELQSERFENQFEVRYDVDETTLSTPLPKMMIQPLVENFFKHGLNPLQEDNLIIITSRWLSSSTLQISVEDNGNGMEPEAWEALQQDIVSDKASVPSPELSDDGTGIQQEGIGLINILTRLKLYYGEDSLFQAENLLPHGFRIILTMNVEGEQR